MKLTTAKIAFRYLLAKKSHNAINIVSAISAIGIAVVTAALICVMSVMNGFQQLVQSMFTAFDPQLKITSTTGKTFIADSLFIQQLQQIPQVQLISKSIQETALIRFGQKQVPATILGVDQNFQQLTSIDSLIIDGTYSVADLYQTPDGQTINAFERCVLGVGLAQQIGIKAHFVSGIQIYAPKRIGKINTLRPDLSLNQQGAFISAIFAVNQSQYDDKLMLVSIQLAQQLFQFQNNEISALSLKLIPNANVNKTQQTIAQLLGPQFTVQNQYQQQAEFYRIVKIEKILTILLLSFILLIASFNIISSLSLLIIDKQTDIQTLKLLGANTSQIRHIFHLEGTIISLLGAAIGLILGITTCLIQQHYGILQLGSGTDYIISAYPVQLQLNDILLTILLVSVLGITASYIPTKNLKETK